MLEKLKNLESHLRPRKTRLIHQRFVIFYANPQGPALSFLKTTTRSFPSNTLPDKASRFSVPMQTQHVIQEEVVRVYCLRTLSPPCRQSPRWQRRLEQRSSILLGRTIHDLCPSSHRISTLPVKGLETRTRCKSSSTMSSECIKVGGRRKLLIC